MHGVGFHVCEALENAGYSVKTEADQLLPGDGDGGMSSWEVGTAERPRGDGCIHYLDLGSGFLGACTHHNAHTNVGRLLY